MSNASEYLINKSLGKEVNPKNWKVIQIAVPSGAPRIWQFPDGSKMTESRRDNTDLVLLEEVK